MKSIEEQRADKIQAIGELIIQQCKCLANAMNTDLSDEERGKNALQAILIQEVHIPMIEAQPIQLKEYPKGGLTIVSENGPELLWQANENGEFKIRLQKGDRIVRPK